MTNFNLEKYNVRFWKGIFLNDLIDHFKFKSYLELGVATGETWVNVNCDLKVGVDSNHSIQIDKVLTMTTDQYFEYLPEDDKFDLIFIDACHEKSYVKKDFLNSFNHLNDGGIIVMHDIGPFVREWVEPWSCHGDGFELWIALADRYPDNVFTFCGDITASKNWNLDQYSGECLDYVGIFSKNDLKEIDSTIFDNTDYGFDHLDKNRDKYLYSKKFKFTD